MKKEFMRSASQTLIAVVRNAVNTWRRREGWSRETVVMEIVETHARLDGPMRSGIVFDPATRDTFERAKVNADRVFRWLDDESKDTNLLPANFLPVLIAALPQDLRLDVVGELLADTGLHADLSLQATTDYTPTQHLRVLLKEFGEAVSAMGDIIDGHEEPAKLASAEKELAEIEASIAETRAYIQQRRNACRLHVAG